MENDSYMCMSKEYIGHMNWAGRKKLTYETIQVALSLHEKHVFHLAVATDGAKKGEIKTEREQRGCRRPQSYGVWQGRESAKIL
eukprot:2173496-Pleurochrysis_carterae.AAC.1